MIEPSGTMSNPAPPGMSAPRCWGILLAGGMGSRLGETRPKAFASLAGRPLLQWSLATFAGHPEITDLLVVIPRGWERTLREEVLAPFMSAAPDSAAKIRGAIPGGERRQDSARVALKTIWQMWQDQEQAQRDRLLPLMPPYAAAAPERAAAAEGAAAAERVAAGQQAESGEPHSAMAGPGPLVLIHDAARPLVPAELITGLIAAFRSVPEEPRDAAGDQEESKPGESPPKPKKLRRKVTPASPPKPMAVIPVVPVGDTLKALDRLGRVAETVQRDSLWQAQTPQAFGLTAVLDLHAKAMETGFAATDDAMLYEWSGYPVKTVLGSPLNMKVTFPQDLALLEAWLARHGAAQ